MIDNSEQQDFLAEFQTEVHDAIEREIIAEQWATSGSNVMLGATEEEFGIRYKVNLYPTDDEKERLADIALKCAARAHLNADFEEWFTLAYIAGLAYFCRSVDGVIYIHTRAGYERWVDLSKEYPLVLLREKIDERRKLVEQSRSSDPHLAAELLARPIIWRETSDSTEKATAAENIVRRVDVRKYLCPVLQSVSDDAFDLSKTVTPILVTLSFTGTISIPLEPTLFANIILIISRMGIAALCVGYLEKPTEKKGAG